MPYPRYGESVADVMAQIEAVRGQLEAGAARAALQLLLAPGAARNAVDCALWDLEGKLRGQPVAALIGGAPAQPVISAETIVIDDAGAMAAAARALNDRPLLKVKLDDRDVLQRLTAVRQAAPRPRLIIDANESWDIALLQEVMPHLRRLGVALIEQPLPASADAALEDFPRFVPICADESCHSRADLARVQGRYDAINIKLDKAGGLSEGLALLQAARARGLAVMIGCMVATSLAIAPALLLAASADFVDLDGALWLMHDRAPGLVHERGKITPPAAGLWGEGK